MTKLQDRVALITGSDSGIGQATAMSVHQEQPERGRRITTAPRVQCET